MRNILHLLRRTLAFVILRRVVDEFNHSWTWSERVILAIVHRRIHNPFSIGIGSRSLELWLRINKLGLMSILIVDVLLTVFFGVVSSVGLISVVRTHVSVLAVIHMVLQINRAMLLEKPLWLRLYISVQRLLRGLLRKHHKWRYLGLVLLDQLLRAVHRWFLETCPPWLPLTRVHRLPLAVLGRLLLLTN